MTDEQKLIIIYLLIGIVSGVISYFFSSKLILAVIIPFLIYVISYFIITKRVTYNIKKIQVFYETLLTFILIWVIVWILLFNLFYVG